MTKRKVPERACDCVTLQDKISFSLMVAEKLEALNDKFWSGPTEWAEIMDRYDDPNCPWSDPAWASNYARAEEEKARVLRSIARDEKRQANRRLYGKIK